MGKNLGIMAANNGSHIAHTAVATFDIVSIKQCMIAVVTWKMLIQQSKECLSNVGYDILVKRGVEPDYFSLSLLRLCSLVLF